MNENRRPSTFRLLRRALLPVGAFALVVSIHSVWLKRFPERDPAQSRWVSVGDAERTSWLRHYVETQSHWLGISYGMSLAFATAALRRYRERRLCLARNLAIGGVTLSGLLAVAGCYLLGCCGSPMLIVYLNFFGAAFLPLAKPLMAGITAVSLAIARWWMCRRERLLLAARAPSELHPSCEHG